MATPIQYVPQFIPSNIGLMNQQLGQMQQRYDQAFSDIAQYEDQFAQIPVHASDIEGKNAIMGKFQNDVKKIVDRYGGDYGAAAKDITRQLSKARQDPFFQLAADKRRLAIEEEATRRKLGQNYIPTQSVLDVKAYDPTTGQYADPESLTYNFTDAKELWAEAERLSAGLKDKVRENKLSESKDFPWLLENTTYKGAYQSEVPEISEMIRSGLKQKFGNVPDEYINTIASQLPPQLVGGWTRDWRDNTEYLMRARANSEKSPLTTPIGLGSHATTVSPEERREQAMEYARQTGGTRSVWDGSSNGMIGSSNFMKKSDNPVVNVTMEKIVRNNPDIASAASKPLGDNPELFISGTGKRQLDDNANAMMLQAIKKAEALQKSNAQEWNDYRTKGLGAWWIARPVTWAAGTVGEMATNSFLDNLRTVLKNDYQLDDKYVTALVSKYSQNNAAVNQKISEAWAKEADASDYTELFDFTTLDATTKDGATQLNRVMDLSNSFLSPENFQFRTGELASKTPKEVLEHYKDKKNPEIVGVSGDFENGIVYAVKGDDKSKHIATLNTNAGNQIAIVEAMGRPDLVPVIKEQEYRRVIKDGDKLPFNNNIVYRKSPNGKHVMQTGSDRVLTNSDVAQYYDILGLLPDSKSNPNDPYEFNTMIELIAAAQLLSKQ